MSDRRIRIPELSLDGLGLTLSRHACQRASQRGISLQVIEWVLLYGQEDRQDGAFCYLLRERDVPLDLRSLLARHRAFGVLVVVRDGCVLTCYRKEQGRPGCRPHLDPAAPRGEVSA